LGGGLRPYAGGCHRVFVEVYDGAEALRSVAPLLEYWRGLRPPRASPSRARCGVCPFSGECEYSALGSGGGGV